MELVEVTKDFYRQAIKEILVEVVGKNIDENKIAPGFYDYQVIEIVNKLKAEIRANAAKVLGE
jgi:hypothetical protein